MAALLVARQSALAAKRNLFFVQAVGSPARVPPGMTSTAHKDFYKDLLRQQPNHTKKLPGIVLVHMGMRVRLTTTLDPPFAVQDVEGDVVGIEFSLREPFAARVASNTSLRGEEVCQP